MKPVSCEALKSLVNVKTKAVVFAYLYGIYYDTKEYIDFCKDRDIDVIEDVAQSFCGAQKFNGTPGARLSLFSFGLIKVQTCIYGAVTIVRDDAKLFTTMRSIQEKYPLFTR